MYLATKADALKNWSGAGCDVKSAGVTDAVATMLSPTAGILTFKGTADGTCYGQKVGSIWVTSVYVKDGERWKWNFGINLPAGREGAQAADAFDFAFFDRYDMMSIICRDMLPKARKPRTNVLSRPPRAPSAAVVTPAPAWPTS
jgi:hypothetical protein